MSNITVIGAGNIGSAVAKLALKAGANVQVVNRDVAKAGQIDAAVQATAFGEALTGDVVVLALPYAALDDVVATYGAALAGKTVVETTNPLDWSTFNSLVVAAGSSATAELAERLPNSHVLKAFNTNFASTLTTGKIGENLTTVLVAGDDAAAKKSVVDFVTAGGLRAIDAGALARAHELEAVGFLQLTLAASEQIGWTGGFAVVA